MQWDAPELISLIKSRSKPLAAAPPSLPHPFASLRAAPLPRVPRAVLFDVYGTLFASGTGDISLSRSQTAVRAVEIALAELDDTHSGILRDQTLAHTISDQFRRQINEDHDRKRKQGKPFPEIEVREIWATVLLDSGIQVPPTTVERFALAYELAANPVWPMPEAASTISRIRGRVLLGLVSNAQFYTPLLFPALLEADPEGLGFSPWLVAYSFQHRIAKPDPALFDGPLAALAEQGIDSNQVVYVGNDMLNDVGTAAARGCMTILFAGDARSLRLRRDPPAAGSKLPDTVAQSLREVADTVLEEKEEP